MYCLEHYAATFQLKMKKMHLEEALYTDNRLIAPVESGDFYALHAVAREHEERYIEESEKRLKTDQAPDLDEQIQRKCRRVARLTRDPSR